MLKLNYKELFSDLDFEGSYPIETFATVIPKVIGTSRDILHLDFSGIDRLSDEVFYVLKEELKVTQKQNVEIIDLTGCCKITDRGIEILAESFINLKELILIGCSQITQLSLVFLMENCPKLSKLSAKFTKISYIPNAVDNRWDKESLACNSLFKENESAENLPINLVILVMDSSITCDIGHYLVTGTIRNRKTDQPIIYQPKALNINETNINIIQLFCPTVYMAPFICDRSLFIIATDLESDTSNAFNIIKGLDFIRGVVYCCPIQIFSFTSSANLEKLEELNKVLQSIFSDQQVNMKEHLDQEHYSKSVDKYFIDQWRYVQSLSAIDPEHISLQLLGLYQNDSNCSMNYYATICEPSTSAKIEQTIADFYETFVNVRDTLDRINKSDISETKSYAKLPDGLEKIIQCLIQLFQRTQSVSQFLNDPMLMTPFRDYKLLTDDENPENSLKMIKSFFDTKENLTNSSRGVKLGTAFGLWIEAKWTICEKLAPLRNKLNEFQSISKTRNDVKTPLELVSINLKYMTKYMYQHLPSKPTEAILIVTKYIDKQQYPIVTIEDMTKEITELTTPELSLVLDQIQTTGKVISLFNIGLVIIKIEWFINSVNTLLTNWNSPLNNDRVWFITSQAVLSSIEELAQVLNEFSDGDLFRNFLRILQHYGLILPVYRSWNTEPVSWEPVDPLENFNRLLYMSWHQLSLKPDSNMHLVVNKPDLKSYKSTRVLHNIFPDYNTPEFNKDDLSFKFSFKFRIGIPCNLFCQVVSKISVNFRTILLWSQGILVREGAVEVLILLNIHASRGSSSFDIESRIRGPIDGRRPVAVREHNWSILSEIITIIEAYIIEYPHLHHKVRHYCRGQCYKEFGQENTLSQAEVSKHLNCNYYCGKCREYQMSRSDWLYILGRQMVLPNHDFDKTNKGSCKSCWKRKPFIEYLWKSQRKIFPTFGSKVFYSKTNKNIKGNLILSGSTESSIISKLKCMKDYLQFVEFQIIDPTNTFIIFYQKVGSSETELFSWNLESGEIVTELKHNSIESLCSVKSGNTLGFHFLVDNFENPIMKIKINHSLFGQFNLIHNANIQIRIKVISDNDELEKTKIIISSLNAGVVGAFHFRPGMILLLKGETKWEPAVITEIRKGKLNCQPLSTIDFNTREIRSTNDQLLSTNSTSILPPGFYPSEINSILDSKNQKSLADSWYKILSQYSEFTPAPFGLFPRLVDKPAYGPLPIFGEDSRECTSSTFCPSKILKLMFFNKPISNRTLTSYLPLPYPLNPIQLLIPQRQIISHYKNHALHRLCPGSLWRNYLRDMHPMNETPYQLTEGEAKYFFQGDFILDIFTIIKNFTNSFSAVYQNIDECFPLIDPDIDKNFLRDAVISISKAYRDIILFDIVAKIQIYSNNIMFMDKTGENILSSRKTNKSKLTSNKTTLAPIDSALNDKFSTLSWTENEMGNIQEMFQKKYTGCESHKLATKVMQIPDLGSYCRCIANIAIKLSVMDNVKETGLVTCSKLRKLEVDFGTMINISWIIHLPQLSSLTLSNCGLYEIGPEITHLKDSLKQLCLDGNPIQEVPEILCMFSRLNSLELNNTLITVLPDNIGNLKLLKYLSIEHTKLSNLPESFSQLRYLATLKLSGVSINNLFGKRSLLSKKEWNDFCNKTHINGYVLKEKEIFNLFESISTNDDVLNRARFDELKTLIFESIPRFREFPLQILQCTNLQALIFANQAFPIVPDEIQSLKHLKKFVIDGCVNLHTLSGYVGTLPLEILSCQNCDNLKTPPYEIRKQGMRNMIAYLLRLVSGSETCYRTKLMLVGLGGAGKTSLMRALTNKNYCAPQIAEEAITDGIDINSWSTKTENMNLQYSIWDFAGQTLYYNTHQFFLTERAIYLLIWNVRQGFEHAGLDFWLNSVTCHAPSAPIFIVGTHSDKVDKSEIPTTHFKSRYPSVVGFFFISSLTGKGVKELHDIIIEETKRQPYIGELVPNAWLRFEKDLISQRSSADYLNWDAVKKLANHNAIYDGEVNQAVRFLHDLGSIQYFEFPLLKDFVIINSQWLVDVMACVVSVKNSIIENGKLEHSRIKLVWSKYPESIHNWLLRLTEIFDLTFSVPGQTFNFIPCLLPNVQPEFHWPEFVDFNQTREANMFYQFEYLPPGLFNRAQVRLSQFSDSFIIWQNGSLLNKNNDKALLTKLNDTTLRVCARGYWPENILFIVHEMFETLISEAFSGVKYEYQISCKKCIAEREPEPYIFNKSILQRAIQLKTIFIQCHKNFHIITMTEIQESTPPDTIEDYDLQFKKSVHFISANRDQPNHSIMILVSDLDYRNDSDLLNTSKRLVKDLSKNQFTVWCEPLIEGTPEDQYIDILTRSEAVISMISGNFTNNKLCMVLFKLSKITLRKTMILARIDKNYTDGTLGLETAGDKYINFERANVYDQKFNELLHDLSGQLENTNSKSSNVPKPRVFISYCWDNSQRAYDNGNSKVLNKNAIGWGDPRDIKDYIEQQGLSCWLDIEMIGSSSVYSEITSGLRHSEIMVACLSTEYAQSDACKKEFMFARQNLNLPIIIAEVGCTQDWIKTEIGLLSIEYPKIQFQTFNPSAFDEIYNLVSSKIPAVAPNVEAEVNTAKMNKIASQEDFELIQRKIFRLLSSGFGSEESRLYPRLFFIDINDEIDENTIINDVLISANPLFDSNLISSNIPKMSLSFKVLCESETGWHTIDDGIPINLSYSELERLIILGAPYLYRITLLLKFSGGENIRLFNSDANQDITKYLMDLLESNSKSWGHMKPIHNAIRTHIMSRDINLKYGGLQSCCLNNGKVVWLCNEHSNLPYISVIGSEESGSLIKLDRRRTQKDEDMVGDSSNYEDSQTIKDSVLIEKMEEIMKEQFSDTDSSVDNRKGGTETNKFLQMVTLTPQKINKTSPETPPKLKSLLPGKKLIPPLEVVKNPPNFQSKTCLIM